MAGAVNRISTVLTVDASQAAAGFRQAEKAAGGYESKLTGLSSSMRDNRAAWDQIGSTAMIAGGALAGGLGLATKAAIGWESAWAGVTKTTDGTPEQMAALEEGLRGLAKTLPATHEELAGVAEAAGQLGIAREDILAFTETAVALGETTNLSAEEAATGLAKISNVMGTQAEHGIEGIERMASTLVALGNAGASTEADILAMGQRLAGAGEQIGASEADILAMASALSSVGIEAQLGGGAMSRAMLKMNSAVISGSEELQSFAQIAGMSAAEFAEAWRSDPIAATNAFVTGLGGISESGGDAAAALDAVGLGGTENAQVLLRAAGASDLLTDSLQMGASAWEANTALQAEAAKRYETDAARIQVAMNQIKDAAIEFGAAAAPVLAGAAEAVGGLADAYGSLPSSVKTFTTGVAGVTAGALLLGGAAIKVVGFAHDIGDAFGSISNRGPRAEAAISGVGRSARIAAGGFLVLAAAKAAADAIQGDYERAVGPAELAQQSIRARDAVNELNAALEANAARSGEADSQVRTLGEAMKIAFDPSWLDSFAKGNAAFWETVTFGLADITTSTEEAEAAFALMDETLAGMVNQGNAAGAAQLLGQYASQAEAAGYSTEDLLNMLPLYAEAAAGVENASGGAADGAEELAGGLSEAEQAAAAAEAAMDQLRSQLEMLGGGFRAEQAASRAVTESIKAMQDVVASGEGGWAALSASMEQSAADALTFAAAQAEMGRGAGVITSGLAQVREQVIQAGVSAGKSRPFMEAYADSIGLIPSEALTHIRAAGVGEATARVAKLDETIMLLNGKTVTVEEAGALVSQGRVKGLDTEIVGLDGKTVEVTEIGSTAAGNRVVLLDGKIQVLDGKTVTVQEQGADPSRGRVTLLDAAIGRVHGKQVNVGAVVYGTSHVDNLRWAIEALRNKTITVTTYHQTLYRNNTPRRSPGPWNYDADGGVHERTAGGLGPKNFADGGIGSFRGQMPHIRPAGGAGVTWAEEGAGPWEAWISGHPAKTSRSKAIADDVVARLGGAVVWPTRMADGGTRDYQQVRAFTASMPRASAQSPAPSLTGLEIVGTLDTPDGTARIRGIVRGELTAQARSARVQRSVR